MWFLFSCSICLWTNAKPSLTLTDSKVILTAQKEKAYFLQVLLRRLSIPILKRDAYPHLVNQTFFVRIQCRKLKEKLLTNVHYVIISFTWFSCFFLWIFTNLNDDIIVTSVPVCQVLVSVYSVVSFAFSNVLIVSYFSQFS